MLVNCVGYQNGSRVRDLQMEEIPAFYRDHAGGFVWVAFCDPTPDELKLAQLQFHLPALAIEDTRKARQRSKLEEYENCLFLVIKSFEYPDAHGKDWNLGEVHIFAGSNFVVSVRMNYSKGFSDVRDRCEREPHLLSLGPGFILYALLDSMVDRYFPIVSHLEEQLENLEERIFRQHNPTENIEVLYSLKQRVIHLKHSASDLNEAIGKLYGGRVPAICMGVQDYFRDVADHLYRINSSIETLREMLITALHVNLTMVSISDSQVSKKLAAWAAILAVPTMIAGIYGMNFKHMPELEWTLGYPVVLLSIAAIDLFLFYRFKKTRWI